jgi:hypothetical protein
MSSLAPKPAPFAHELIEKEIAHLLKRKGTRHAAVTSRTWSKMIVTAVVLGLITLWGLDTVLFSYNRGDAIRVYLYLHNYGNDAKADAVAQAGYFTPSEIHYLDARQGQFQDYFPSRIVAEAKGAELVAYGREVRNLHQGHEDMLSPLDKVRYFLFVKTGLIPPTRWDVLNPSIDP